MHTSIHDFMRKMMMKLISLVLAGLLFCLNSYGQQKSFGYRISGNDDIVSNLIFIQSGFVLDSAVNRESKTTYRFEYNEQGRLKRDINFWYVVVLDGRLVRHLPGYRDYFYNERGDVDSVAQGHWNDSMWVADSMRYRIDYQYDTKGNIISRTYSSDGLPSRIEENAYDSSGNLLSNSVRVRRESTVWDTTYTAREYDSQNRITTATSRSSNPSYISKVLYQYDSLGNVAYTVQDIENGAVHNNVHYRFIFDTSDRVTELLQSFMFLPDSTWRTDWDLLYLYDANGRMVSVGEDGYSPFMSCSYDVAGNLDTLVWTHIVDLRARGVALIDSYGNSITLPELYGTTCFYYGRLVTGVKRGSDDERTFRLSQNYPNPFNPTTTITYSLPHRSHVMLTVFNALGQQVATLVNGDMEPGYHTVQFDGSHLSSGMYFYRLQAGSFVDTKKLLLVK